MKEYCKEYCLECGVEVFDGGSWGYCVPCGNRVFDKLIADKLKATNNTRPNHAVGEVYKPNIHDPYNQHRWVDEEPVWVKAFKVLGVGAAALGMAAVFWLFTVLMFVM